MARVIDYLEFNPDKNYIVYCDNLFEANEWRLSFCEEYRAKTTTILDVNLQNDNDIKTMLRYFEAFGINESWWRMSCGECYRSFATIKRIYGSWTSFSYLNNLAF